jgi:hypothetical protein
VFIDVKVCVILLAGISGARMWSVNCKIMYSVSRCVNNDSGNDNDNNDINNTRPIGLNSHLSIINVSHKFYKMLLAQPWGQYLYTRIVNITILLKGFMLRLNIHSTFIWLHLKVFFLNVVHINYLYQVWPPPLR